ncbi:MAG: PIG-L family deacetylase [Nocardioidaceae bacterium]|nr:PIG-L family deacetylase [Nocardioidaceae bacterium]
MPAPLPVVERALVVTAHPDDADFGTAGTVAQWTGAGTEVTYLVLTDGQAGGFDDATDRGEIPAIRHREQRAAAARVGVDDVRFLGGIDGELAVTLDLVREISAVIRAVRPQRVLTQSPERDWQRLYRSHPDHLAAGEATVQAVYPAARNPYAFPELRERGLEAWTVGELWLAAHPRPDHAVDVTDTFEAKIDAILSHRSQHPDPDAIRPMLHRALGDTAQGFGLPAGRLAEAFLVVDLP